MRKTLISQVFHIAGALAFAAATARRPAPTDPPGFHLMIGPPVMRFVGWVGFVESGRWR